MEAVSLAVAFPGFINDGIELRHRFQAVKSFQTEAGQAWILLKSNLTRLQIWEEKVGVKDGKLTDDHDKTLDDPDVLSNVRGHLRTARELSTKIEKALARLSPETSNPTATRSRLPFPSKSGMKWGFGHDKTILGDLEKCDKHVDKLYQLVTPKLGKDREDSKISDELKAMQSQFSRELSRVQRQEINEWIQAELIDQQFDTHRDARMEGTGDWIFNHHAYQSWFSGVGDPKFLWLCGPAGSGKTVLSATVIQHLRDITSQGPPVVYCFCSVYAQAGTQLQGIIRSFISQFARQSVDMREQIWEHMHSSSCDGDDVASQSDLWTILKRLLQGTSGCTLIIDGLDEFDGSNRARSKFLRHIKSTVQNTSTKVMVASRDEGDIRDELFDAHVCNISKDLVRADIQKLAEALVFERLPRKKEELKHELSERLTEKSDGMFLWIKQQNLLLLRGSKTDFQLRQIVDKMPSGLTDTYMRNWREITNQADDDYARTLSMLRWAAFSFRPLTVVEITEALMMHPESSSISQEEWPDEINEEYIQEELKGLCGSLVNISATPEEGPSSSTVHLAHASVKEFLLSMLDTTLQNHHAELARICLRYLNLSQVWKRAGSRIPYAFLGYAIDMWHKHSEAAVQQNSETLKLINSLLDPDGPIFSSMRGYLLATDPEISVDEKANRKKQPGNPLWWATEWNMVETAKQILSTHPNLLDAMEPGQETPLIRACGRGYTILANLLIDNNANVEIYIGGRGPALTQAATRGHMDLVASLVDRGLDMESRDFWGRTAFLAACGWNQADIAMFLLERGANQAVLCSCNTTPFYWACRYGNLDLVMKLLDASRGFIMLQTKNGNTPLAASVYGNHLKTAEYLLENGAGPCLKMVQSGKTPLLNAAQRGYLDMLHLLLAYGADIQALDDTELSALHLASYDGHTAVVGLLLDYGANPMARSDKGWLPIHVAAYYGHLDITEHFLNHGVEANIRNDLGFTPLHYAARANNQNLVKVLLGHGAVIDAKTEDGQTPFHIAIKDGHLEIAQYLAGCGANATMRIQDSLTPLHIAAYRDHAKLIPFLLRHGANIHDQSSKRKHTPLYTAIFQKNYAAARALCEHGDTRQFSIATDGGHFPLGSAAELGFTSIVELLIEHGADPTCGDLTRRTPLFFAAGIGNEDIVRILIRSQADFKALCGDYWSPLNAGAHGGHIATLEILAKKQEVTSFVPDCEGRCALHLAARGGRVPMFKFLLEAGLDPTLRDCRNRTVLHYAAASSSIEMVECILHLPCISSILSETRGWSILHWAAIAGSCQLIQLLISAGLAERCITTRFQQEEISWTPWNIAQFFDNQNLLLDTDCPLRLRDEPANIHPGAPPNIELDYHCDSCESRIFGPRYVCNTCDRSVDYCFMCMIGVEDLHPGHQLKQADIFTEES